MYLLWAILFLNCSLPFFSSVKREQSTAVAFTILDGFRSQTNIPKHKRLREGLVVALLFDFYLAHTCSAFPISSSRKPHFLINYSYTLPVKIFHSVSNMSNYIYNKRDIWLACVSTVEAFVTFSAVWTPWAVYLLDPTRRLWDDGSLQETQEVHPERWKDLFTQHKKSIISEENHSFPAPLRGSQSRAISMFYRFPWPWSISIQQTVYSWC